MKKYTLLIPFIMFLYVCCFPAASDIISKYLIRVSNSAGTVLGYAHTLKGATSLTAGVATFTGGGGGTSEVTVQGSDGVAVVGNLLKIMQGTVTNNGGTTEITINNATANLVVIRGTVNQVGGITKGQPVYVVSAASSLPAFAIADNRYYAKAECAGIALETKSNNASITIAKSGLAENMNTNAWNEGDELYLYQGSLTNSEPASGLVYHIGYVTEKSATTGKILVGSHVENKLSAETDANTEIINGGAGKYISIQAGDRTRIATIDNIGNYTSKATANYGSSVTTGAFFYGNGSKLSGISSSVTNDYISVNHIKLQSNASSDLTAFPSDSNEIIFFNSKETKKIAYMNYSKKIYTFTPYFWKKYVPQVNYENLTTWTQAVTNASVTSSSFEVTVTGASEQIYKAIGSGTMEITFKMKKANGDTSNVFVGNTSNWTNTQQIFIGSTIQVYDNSTLKGSLTTLSPGEKKWYKVKVRVSPGRIHFYQANSEAGFSATPNIRYSVTLPGTSYFGFSNNRQTTTTSSTFGYCKMQSL